MKTDPKIDFLHLLLTVFTTAICVVPTFIILLIIQHQVFSNLYSNEWNDALKIFLLEIVVYTIALTILLRKSYKINSTNPRKSFSFKISSILLTILFCWYARFPLHNLLTLDPSEKSDMELIDIDTKKIENFIKENNTTDSLTTKQIDKLVDTLGNGWKRVDTARKN